MKDVVIDTNIVISSVISQTGNPSAIMDLVSDKEIQVYYSNEVLDEYKKVLAYERLKIDPRKQTEIIEKVKEIGIFITPEKSGIPMTHEDDRVFYDTAKAANAILITGNIKHYPNEKFIMTPTEYLRERERENIHQHDR